MKKTDDRRLILALSIQRMTFLHSDEKLLIWDLVDEELSLSLLLRKDVEAAIGRSLGSHAWAPDSFLEAALSDAHYLDTSGCRFIHYDDEAYPRALRETTRPPFGLFARGRDLDPAAELAAIVGTRVPTGRGGSVAYDVGRELAEAGVIVVSGLARGIDSAAHRGALGAHGGGAAPTCAVLACGIDGIYPPGNKGLAGEILERGGLLLSEYPPGEEIHKYRFPERNRIIAGMCRACVVVEAPAKSGALITAEHALDEGRDLWVSRDCLGGPRSAGIDRLAAEGAPALAGASDLLEDWGREIAPAEPRAPPRFDCDDEGGRLASALYEELNTGAGKGRTSRPSPALDRSYLEWQ
jgi:DNA processing protein